MDDFGLVFPCGAFVSTTGELPKIADTLKRFDRTLISLLEDPDRAIPRLTTLEQEADDLLARVDENALTRLKDDCALEDELASGLTLRRRALVDRVLRGEDFSIDAAKTFSEGQSSGGVCRWTVDCNIPLLCRQGRCAGRVSADDALLVLGQAKALADKALQLKLHDDHGLVPTADEKVAQMEVELEEVEASLKQLGWEVAVQAWRKDFVKSLGALLQDFDAQLAAAGDEFDDDAQADDPRACRSARKRVGRTADALRGVAEALGEADPVASPRWVHLKLTDIRRLRERFDENRTDLQAACGIPEGVGLPWIALAAGLAGLFLVVALVVLLGRRRKTHKSFRAK